MFILKGKYLSSWDLVKHLWKEWGWAASSPVMVMEKGCSWCGLLILHMNDAGIKNRISFWLNFECELSILLKEKKKKGSICIFLGSLKCYIMGKKISLLSLVSL